MPEGELNPAQAKFFAAHINKGLLGKLRDKKDLAFVAAFRAYTDADKAAQTVLTNLPMYPNGSPEFVEKNAIIERYKVVTNDTLAKTSKQKKAIAACEQGRTDLGEVTKRAKSLMSKALTDTSVSGSERIVLLKQNATLHLITLRDDFTTKSAHVLAEITKKTGTATALPVASSFETGLAAILADIAAVKPDTQSAKAAEATISGLMSKADKHLAEKLIELNTFAASPAMAQVIEVGQMDGALRSALAVAKSISAQTDTWNVPGAKGFAAETEVFDERAAALFTRITFDNDREAEAAKADRTSLKAEIDALNARAAKAIQEKKLAFGQLFRDVEARFAIVERAFRDIDDVTFAKGQKAPIDDFMGLTRTAINDLNGYNTDALVAAKKLVDQAAVMVTDAQKATEINARLKEQLTKMGGAIDQSARKGNPLAAKFAEHKAEHAELSAKWQTMVLSEASAAVREFLAKVVADVQLSRGLDARRVAARKELAAAKADLALFNTAYGKMLKAYGHKVKPYEGPLTNDLATAESWIETKTVLSFYDTIDSILIRARKNIADMFTGLNANQDKSDDDIYQEALALQRELEEVAREAMLGFDARGEKVDPQVIANARASVDAQLAQLSTRSDLLAQDNDNERQKAEEAARQETYLNEAGAYVKTIKAELKAAEENSALDHHKSDVKTHLERIEGSMKTVKKGGSVQGAQSELAFLQKTITGLKARGPRTDKKKLTEIGTQWADAVKGFGEKCSEMQTAVEKYLQDNQLDTDYAAQLTMLSKALSDIQTRLEPAAFIRVANRFNEPTDFKSTREEALQKVRYFNDLLLKDPVIQQCVQNPFGVRDFASVLASRLRQIELNVLRAA